MYAQVLKRRLEGKGLMSIEIVSVETLKQISLQTNSRESHFVIFYDATQHSDPYSFVIFPLFIYYLVIKNIF